MLTYMREQLSGTASASSDFGRSIEDFPTPPSHPDDPHRELDTAPTGKRYHRYNGQGTSLPDTKSRSELTSRNSPLRILLTDENSEIRNAFSDVARSLGFLIDQADSATAARKILERKQIDIFLLDVTRAESQNQSLFEEMKVLYPETLVILTSACGTIESAVTAMKGGAWDFLSKPFPLHVLTKSLQRAADRRYFDLECRNLREMSLSEAEIGTVLGRSPEMEKLYRILSSVADSKHPVMILGENGTGKPLLARSIHANGPNATRPFVALDCQTLGETLLEDELFGQAKSTVNSDVQEFGLLTSLQDGTLFLEKIDYMSVELQRKLVNALKEREIRPIGGNPATPVSVRIIAATDRDLTQMVAAGLFRRDLYQRLSVVNLRIPPLRGRPDDIAFLAKRYLEKNGRQTGIKRTLSDETLRLLETYEWPDNLRELEQSITSACSQTPGSELHAIHLPRKVLDFHLKKERKAKEQSPEENTGSSSTKDSVISIAEMEKRAILEALRETKGDKLKAARLLDIGKTTLYRKLKEYGLGDSKSRGYLELSPNSMRDSTISKSTSVCA
jgi:two-component system response regulator HydG